MTKLAQALFEREYRRSHWKGFRVTELNGVVTWASVAAVIGAVIWGLMS